MLDIINDTEFGHADTVSATRDFDVEALEAYLAEHLDEFVGPMVVERGTSNAFNPTYKLHTRDATYIMRTRPAPAAVLPTRMHAIEREFRVMRALADTEVPVPRALLLCEDESVIGRAFYIKEFVEGRVVHDHAMPWLSPSHREALYDDMNRVIAALHSVNVKAAGLQGFGHEGNYFARQISRWSRAYSASTLYPSPVMPYVVDWLLDNMPRAASRVDNTAIVHGSFMLHNMVLHPTEPRIIGVLDWQLSTLGHPLADFSAHCMAWHMPPDALGLRGLDLRALGIPNERDYIRRYVSRSGRDEVLTLIEDWRFYRVFNLFRAAAISQTVAQRAMRQGTGSQRRYWHAEDDSRGLVDIAWQVASDTFRG